MLTHYSILAHFFIYLPNMLKMRILYIINKTHKYLTKHNDNGRTRTIIIQHHS